MRELKPGLWHWTAAHPEWTPQQWWPREVSSYAIDDGARLLLIDPQTVPDELIEVGARREAVVVLTAPWHERDAKVIVERLGASVWSPPPETAEDLMRKYNVTREQAGDGSPDLAWLRTAEGVESHFYAAGDDLPSGIRAYLGREEQDLILWVPRLQALISGDTLVDFGSGFGINEHLRGGVTREVVAERLRQLLDLPVELVLPTHGEPTSRAALARALS